MKVLSLQSGTSVDGIDLALVEFTASGDSEHPLLDARVLEAGTQTWPEDLRSQLLEFSGHAWLGSRAVESGRSTASLNLGGIAGRRLAEAS